MALENVSMDEESMETIDRFITNAIGYITKKSKRKVDEPTIINFLLNKNNSVNVEKHLFEIRKTLLTANQTKQ